MTCSCDGSCRKPPYRCGGYNNWTPSMPGPAQWATQPAQPLQPSDPDTTIATLRADLAASQAEVERLREALEPFADLCRTATIADALSFAPHADCDLTVSRGWDNATIKASVFAAARAAMAPKP